MPVPWSARSCRHRWGRGTGTTRAAGSGPAGPRAARRTALLTAATASSWPINAATQHFFHLRAAFHALLPASCRPEYRSNATPRQPMSLSVTSSSTIRCPVPSSSASSSSFFSRSGIMPYASSPARARSPSRCARASSIRAASRFSFTFCAPASSSFSDCQISVNAADFSSRSARSISSFSSRSCDALSVSLFQGFTFDLQLDDLAVQLVYFFRLGINLHPQP